MPNPADFMVKFAATAHTTTEVYMSFNPCRQRGSAAGIHARRRAADAHRGTRHDFLRRHEMEATEAARGSPDAKRKFASKLLKRIADHRNLHAALDYLASEC